MSRTFSSEKNSAGDVTPALTRAKPSIASWLPCAPWKALQRALELLLVPDQERRSPQPLEIDRAQDVLAIGLG
jgi:hypothetical protein